MGGCGSHLSAKSGLSPCKHPNVQYRKRRRSIKIAFDGISTAPVNILEQSPSLELTEIELTSTDRQSQNDGFKYTNMSIEVLDQVKKLLSTDNPEAKVVAQQLRECIMKLPTSENCKKCQVAHTMSKALDYNISRKENDVSVTWEPEDDPNVYDCSNSTLTYVEGGLITLPGDSLSRSESGGTEIVMRVSDDNSDSGEWIARTRDDGLCEMMKGSHYDMIQFSKKQLIRSRRRSNMMSDVLQRMPSLTESLANTTISRLKEFNGGHTIYQDRSKDRDVESMTSKIDGLDVKIHKSMQKLRELRKQSLDIFTDGDDSGDSDQKNLKNISFVSVEKKINRWQDYKNKLADERNQIITKLNYKLMDQITSTPLIESSTESEFSDATSRCLLNS